MSRRDVLSLLGCAAVCGTLPGAASGDVAAIDRDKKYPGIEDGAGWRAAALQRIETQRKFDFSIRLVDGAGRAIGGRNVDAALYRHAFGFGGGMRLREVFDEQRPLELRQQYQELSAQLFHKVVALNALKWKHIERNEPYIDPFFDWSAANELPIRGHTLVWPDFQRAPANIAKYADDPEGLREAINAHLEYMITRCRGHIAEWDVLNEPFTQHTYMDLLGKSAAVDWFETVRKLDPDAKRYINDYGVLTRVSEEHRDYYFDYISGLLEAGAPVQGIGFQAHNPARFAVTAPETILATLDRFAALGLPQQITEFDVESKDEDFQARYTEDFMIAVFSHPSTVGLLTWTPFEYGKAKVSKPDAVFFDRNLRAKANAHTWDELVNRRWSTAVKGATDEQGGIAFRGFAGKYRLNAGAGTTPHTIELDSNKRVAEVTLT